MSSDYNVYSVPEEVFWTKQEMNDPRKRLCSVCDRVCQKVFAKVLFNNDITETFCSKVCWNRRSHTAMSLRAEVKN